jgi:hypothetical protein
MILSYKFVIKVTGLAYKETQLEIAQVSQHAMHLRIFMLQVQTKELQCPDKELALQPGIDRASSCYRHASLLSPATRITVLDPSLAVSTSIPWPSGSVWVLTNAWSAITRSTWLARYNVQA